MVKSSTNDRAFFQVDRSVITRHVNNVFKEREVEKESNVQKMHIANADRPVQFYSLDVIISVGYRVKSQRGIEFRKWANSVLKQYILEGYAINEKRLQALEKTVDIQTKMLADVLDVEAGDILRAVNQYTDALTLLDQYDHQCIAKPEGSARSQLLLKKEAKWRKNSSIKVKRPSGATREPSTT